MDEGDTFETDLRGMIRRGQVVAVVGSGVSMATASQSPTWRGLMKSAAQRCRAIGAGDDWCDDVVRFLKRPHADMLLVGAELVHQKLREKGECAGCRGPLDKHWSPGCKFLPCAKAKGHRYCFQCDDLPCDKLQAFASDGHEHHRLAVENLKQMKALGLDQWIAKQPRVMFCPAWRF